MKKQITLEDLIQHEKKLKTILRGKERKMAQLGQNVISPVGNAVDFSSNVANAINRTYSLYRGFKLGLNLVKMFGLFRKKK